MRKEISITGAYIGKFSFHKLPAIMEGGALTLESVVSHRLPLSKVHEGIELLREGMAPKIVLHPED